MNNKPKLDKNIEVEVFKDYYWLKKELVDFCRKTGISSSNGKIQIAGRIAEYLQTGTIISKSEKQKIKPNSKFDWNSEKLSLQTKITDNYKNTENVRAFFVKNIGKKFKFNVKFMNWMKSNAGQTLENAINEWYKIETEKKNDKSPKEIAPQFEYNRYIRDFLKDNPGKTRKNAIKHWNIKKTVRGNNIYVKSDL